MIALVLLLATAGPLAAQSLPKAASPEAVGLSSERLGRLTRVMKEAVDRRQVAGTVTLVLRNGQVAYHEASGSRDIEAGAAKGGQSGLQRTDAELGPTLALAIAALAAIELLARLVRVLGARAETPEAEAS